MADSQMSLEDMLHHQPQPQLCQQIPLHPDPFLTDDLDQPSPWSNCGAWCFVAPGVSGDNLTTYLPLIFRLKDNLQSNRHEQ